MYLINFWQELLPEIKIILMATNPLLGLRGAIFLGTVIYNVNIVEAYLISITANFLSVIPIRFFLDYIVPKLMGKYKFCHKYFTKLFKKTRFKHSEKFGIYGSLFLVIFIATPLPGTGAWSGVLISYVFGVKLKKSLALIACGITLGGASIAIITAGFDFFVS